MPGILTTGQLAQYSQAVDNGGVEAARQVYLDLYAQGYNYAGWAYGVASGETITGQSALDYLSGSAMAGFGGPACRNLSPEQIDKIRVDMAKGYLDRLSLIAEGNGGLVDRDVRFDETRAFHDKAFQDNGLSIDNWTLETPMELIRQQFGDAAVEQWWQRIRDTGGDGFDAIRASADLAGIVGRSAFSPDPNIRQQAQNWMDRVPGLANWEQIGRALDMFVRATKAFDGLSLWNPDGIILDFNTDFRTALAPRPRDPLAIDLDGDGIETLGIPASGSPVLFDHDADGVRTGTGWLRPDDGWLVRDLDGNGSIDTGRELFGVDTRITVTQTVNGQLQTTTRNAANGFEALSALDTGNGTVGSAGYGDMVFNAQDAEFANLQVWRDLNGDGISQAGELQTLAQAGIASISLNANTSTTNLGNGNSLTGTATVTRSNGSTTQIDSVSMQAGNLNLANNPFYRDFPNAVPVTAAAQALPEMGGSGILRDLRESMSLGTTAAARLTTAVQAFAAATTRTAQKAALDELLLAWAATNPTTTQWVLGAGLRTYDIYGAESFDAAFGAALDARRPGWRSLLAGAQFPTPNPGAVVSTAQGTGLPSAAQQLVDMAVQEGLILDFSLRAPVAYGAGSVSSPRWVAQGVAYQTLDQLSADFQHIAVLQAFNGQDYLGQAGLRSDTVNWAGTNSTLSAPPARVMSLMDQSYQALSDSVYAALALQTRLRPYLDAVQLVIDAAGLRFDVQPLRNLLAQQKQLDESRALTDFVELTKFAYATLDAVGLDAIGLLRSWMDSLPAGSSLRAEANALGVMFGAQPVGSASNDIYLGDATANSFAAGDGDDVLDGAAGDDSLTAQGGNDFLFGGQGNDILRGGTGDDVLEGGAGNDTLAGGNYDTWNGYFGGDGSDTYRFGRGDGQDTIWDSDTTAGSVDRLVFKSGIAPSDLRFVRTDDHLIVKIAGTKDQVQVINFFGADATNGWQIEQIEFADAPGSTLSVADIKLIVLTGDANANTLVGYGSDDTVVGDAGNDTLFGRGGNDRLDGGAGSDNLLGEGGDDNLLGGADNDTLQGGTGNDTLNGGVGNDILAGGIFDTWNGNYDGAGNDTYLFGRGDGQDVIVDDDATVGNVDKIVFKTGVAVADVQVLRDGDTLILRINGTTDQVRVDYFFSNDGVNNRLIEEIRFTDAPTTVWKLANIKAMALAGTAGNDTLQGYATADTISSADGNDIVFGRGGNDTLNGGTGDDMLMGESGDDKLNGDAGNDLLQGGTGNDTFNGGAGNDTLAGGIFDTWNGNYDGAGNDTYLFGRGDGQDVIVDVDATVGNTDVLSFGPGIAADQLWFRRVGTDLEVSIIGTSDKSTISNWYSGSAFHIERFETSDGKVLLDSQVDALVSAMAGFAPPGAGQSVLPASYQTMLNPVIAGGWQ